MTPTAAPGSAVQGADPAALPALADLAEGFSRHIERWSLASGAPAGTAALLRRVAASAVGATIDGHVCIGANELATLGASAERLLESGVVGTPELPGAMPLILDAQGRLYLHRYFDHERRLARRLMQAATAPREDFDPEALRSRLAQLFSANRAALAGAAGAAGTVDWQQIAAALALRGRLTVISGGPGTGKTTTLVNLLACLLERDPGCRVALAAPTGKAAARMTEALRERAAHLPEALRQRLPTESFTIHRLLGVTPSGFRHHAGNWLALDALVVDEASMLDLALATKLLEAVPPTARIVLLGDKDQLSAVESGAVFAELSADPGLSAACRADLAALCGLAAEAIVPAAAAQPSALPDATVWFSRNFRFGAGSGIGLLAADINAGRAEAALARLRADADAGAQWLDDSAAAPSPAALAAIHAGYAPYLEALHAYLAAIGGEPGSSDAPGVAGVLAAYNAFRVLCAVREGARGIHAVNERVCRQLSQALRLPGGDARSPWFPGRPVMVLRNDPVLRLYNGDIGIALPDTAAPGGELKVWFPAAEGDAGGLRAIAPVRLPAHQTAFAMTVHKSQGSEFNAVLLLLPAERNRVLTRELLYTAVTRARERVVLVGGAAVLAAAIRTPTLRRSGLQARLREAADAADRNATAPDQAA